MDELKRFTIKTWCGTGTCICYNIDDFLTETCFCDAYEVIKEEPATNLQFLFDKYFSMIPDDQFITDCSLTYWKNSILQLLSGYYETFEEMYEESKF